MYCWPLNFCYLFIILSTSKHICLTFYETALLGFSTAISTIECVEHISTFPRDRSPWPSLHFLLPINSVAQVRSLETILDILLLPLLLHQPWRFHLALTLKSVSPSMHPLHLCAVLSLRTVMWCLNLQLLVCKLAPVVGRQRETKERCRPLGTDRWEV